MPVISGVIGSTEAPQQYKQSSRKGKKAWRKNIDVTDIQEGLAEGVEEEILFGSRLNTTESDALFAVDTARDDAIQKKFNLKPLAKRLKADEIIASRSPIPAVTSRQKRLSLATIDPAKGHATQKRRKANWVPQKEIEYLWNVADGKSKTSIATGEAIFDVWGDAGGENRDASDQAGKLIGTDENSEQSNLHKKAKLDFLPEIAKIKVPASMRRKPVSLAANGKPIPAVPRPAGGYSYNPDFTAYKQRYEEECQKAVETEEKRLREEADRQVRLEAAARSAAEAEAAEHLAEMASEWEESEWEGFSDGEGLKTDRNSSSKRPERKTPAQRNRVKRRKEAERLGKHQAAMKRRDEQAKRIREIAQEVAEREKRLQLAAKNEATSNDEQEGDDTKLRRRPFGTLEIPEKDLELVLPDELEDSLRRLRPEGNLLHDRYRSLLVRGKLETRRKIHAHRQAKYRLTEKWTHKDFQIL